MGYVFGKAFWWILLALLIGGVIGYYWNGWRKKRWIDSSSTSTSSAMSAPADESGENMRLRTRVAELQADYDTIEAQRDELAARVETLEADLDDCRSQAVAAESAPAMAVGMMPETSGDDEADAAGTADGGAAIQGFAAVAAGRFDDVDYDLEAAAAVLGSKIKMDDLKVVEGIGPKIEELINEGGVSTWAGLADTPIERLREILDAAGERFRIHDPATWPRQAELLASAKWDEFKQLTDELDGGRE